jgi:hypothetical protein
MKWEQCKINMPAKSPIIATVEGAGLCHAAGFTVKDHAPILATCRLLVQAGFDPGRPLLAFRGPELAMRVKTIGYGAKFEPSSW